MTKNIFKFTSPPPRNTRESAIFRYYGFLSEDVVKNYDVYHHSEAQNTEESIMNSSHSKCHCAQNEGKCKFAYTLAEVLITLSILGVVAAMTIPNIVAHYKEKALVTNVKKEWVAIEKAVSVSQIENGPIHTWDLGNENSLSGSTQIYNNMFKNYFKISKECDTNKNECFADSYTKLNGENLTDLSKSNLAHRKTFVINDGTHFYIWNDGNTRCRSFIECTTIWFDVNGKKGPNILGVDLHALTLGYRPESNLWEVRTPVTNNNDNCSKLSNNRWAGSNCIHWIIQNGNMDYLRREIHVND